MTFPDISREAWDAAMVVDNVIDHFFRDHDLTRNEGVTRIPVVIAKLVQTTIDRAEVNWELGKLKESDEALVMYIMRHFDDIEHDPVTLRNRAAAALHDYHEHQRREAQSGTRPSGEN